MSTITEPLNVVHTGLSIETSAGADAATIRPPSDMRLFRPKKLVAYLLAKGIRAIIFDFKNLSSINSVTLGEMVTCHLTVQCAGAHMKVINPPPAIRRVLSFTNLSEILGTEED
jgi:anti-anti-sigma factor